MPRASQPLLLCWSPKSLEFLWVFFFPLFFLILKKVWKEAGRVHHSSIILGMKEG